jgi:hypothetical protein
MSLDVAASFFAIIDPGSLSAVLPLERLKLFGMLILEEEA